MKLWLAPLYGITHYNFRNCFVKHFQGIDCAIAPFIAAKSKTQFNPQKYPDLFPKNNASLPIIPQLMGNSPVEIAETINVLNETYGYEQFNWNIGCPMSQIVRKKRGCGVMPFPDLVEAVVNEVGSKTSTHFSIKMRLGMFDLKEGLEILQRLTTYPIDFICIHPRLGIHQYDGNVDLDTFELFYNTTPYKIVYSGDIYNIECFKYLQNRFPKIENWMLGRGIIQNPFLAEQIVEIGQTNVQSRQDTYPSNKFRFINFYNEYSELLLTLRNEKIALGALKELWHYFSVLLNLGTDELKKLLQINDFKTFHERINKKLL
ncbi:MAG: tRNA-dihydrouridine synthase family protein [Bacteroidales bacterium]|nr:tRNA-dihydrouridine synthase family protein [Bacteroidales bacterium]